MGASVAGTVTLFGVDSPLPVNAKVVTVGSTSISLDSTCDPTSGREAAAADDGGVGARMRTARGGGDNSAVSAGTAEADAEADAATAAAPGAGSVDDDALDWAGIAEALLSWSRSCCNCAASSASPGISTPRSDGVSERLLHAAPPTMEEGVAPQSGGVMGDAPGVAAAAQDSEVPQPRQEHRS